MLNVGREMVRLCEGVSRRSFLQIGSAGLATLSLPTLLKVEAAGGAKEKTGPIRNCITIFLVGSPRQHDTWDIKPDASAEVGGRLSRPKSNMTGVQICERLPLM